MPPPAAMNKKYDAASAKGVSPGSAYSATKNSALSNRSDKYSAKSSAQTPQVSSGQEQRSSYKSVERWDNEKNAALEKNKYQSASKQADKNKSYSSGTDKYSSSTTKDSSFGNKKKDESKDKYASSTTKDSGWGSRNKDESKDKNSSSTTKDASWGGKNKDESKEQYSSSTTKDASWGGKNKDEFKDKYSSSTTKDASWGGKNKDASKDKYSSSTTKDASWGGKNKDESKDKYSSSTTKDSTWGSKNKDESKDKYSFSSTTKAESKTSWTGDKYKTSSSAEDRWYSKNFAAPDAYGRSFSSQSAASSWEERNRGRAFPYDRDHDLRRSQHRYEADIKSLDRLEPKYRKAAMAAGLTVAVGAVGPSSTGKADSRVRDRDDHHVAGVASATSTGTPADPTGCHSCAIQ